MELSTPSLYTLDDDNESLCFHVARCGQCGQLNFPATVYGCARCGADPQHLSPDQVSGRGVLRRYITVHQALLPGLRAPQVIGEIETEDGLLLEAEIACDNESALSTGMTVRAMVRKEHSREQIVIGCHFVPETQL